MKFYARVRNNRIEQGYGCDSQTLAILQEQYQDEFIEAQELVSPDTHYIVDGVIHKIPMPPDMFHVWDQNQNQYVFDIERKRRSLIASVNQELNRRLYLPIEFESAFFDSDELARQRITGTKSRLLEGAGLPAGWVGWRDASNQQRWATDDAATVLANLTALSRAIEDREQALLIASWQHKANLNALEDFNEILSYDTTAGWPS